VLAEPIHDRAKSDAEEMAKPLSRDTSPDAERIIIAGYRRMGPEEKLERVRQMTQAVQQMALVRLRERFPDACERELALRLSRVGRTRGSCKKRRARAKTTVGPHPLCMAPRRDGGQTAPGRTRGFLISSFVTAWLWSCAAELGPSGHGALDGEVDGTATVVAVDTATDTAADTEDVDGAQVADTALPQSGAVKSTDHRARMVIDPDLPFAKHTIAKGVQWISGVADGLYGSKDSGMLKDVPETGLQVDAAGHRSLERVPDPRGTGRSVFRLTIAESYPLYNNLTTRISLGSASYSLDHGEGVEVWCAHSYIPDRSVFGTKWRMSISGLHHVSGWGANAGVKSLTPWSLFLDPKVVGQSAGWFLTTRTNTTVSKDGSWTPAPLNSSEFKETSHTFGQVSGAGEEHKLVINYRVGHLKSQKPKMIVWHKIDDKWQNGGNPVVQHNGPIGYNLADQSMQLRGVAIYNWTSGGNYVDKWPPVNDIPTAGEKGMRAWSRGSICLAEQPPNADEPALSRDSLIKWLER
jgi:hypothetical protein